MVSEVKGSAPPIVVPLDVRPTAAGAVRPTNSAAAAEPPTGSDRVELTSEARRLQEVARLAKEAPDVDAEAVERLRTAISEGSYRVDPVQTAEKVARMEALLAPVPNGDGSST